MLSPTCFGSSYTAVRIVGPGAPKDVQAETIEVSGRVLGPDGKSFQGAKLYLWTNTSQKLADLPVRATTDADGRFRFSATRAELEREAKVMATAKSTGPDWMELTSAKKEEVKLRLAEDDVPITGRIVDLEGRPVAGATIEVAGIDQGKDGDLKAWFKDKARYAYFQQKHLSGKALEGPASVTTGKDGRFRLGGFGRERVVYLWIKGPNIENGFIHVVTRITDVPGERTFFRGVFPAKFDYVASPSKPIVGTVRENGTGKPLAGITVASMHYNKSYATTDTQGRYQLEGVGKHKNYMVAAAAIPYFNSTKMNIADTTGVTTNELWAALPDLPCTQISIALAFLKDRGCVETSGRRSYSASAALHEDALTEFHYLAHAVGGRV